MEILIEKECFYVSSKGTNSTDDLRKQLKQRRRRLLPPLCRIIRRQEYEKNTKLPESTDLAISIMINYNIDFDHDILSLFEKEIKKSLSN